MRCRFLAPVLVVFLACPAFAQMRNAIPVWKLKIENRLAQRYSLTVQSTPLSEVVAILRNTLDVNIVLDATDPATTERPITLDLRDVTGEGILRLVTRQAGLDYALADEAVYISSPERAQRVEPAALAQYDVTDLILNPMASAGSGGNSNNSGNNDSGNNNNSGLTGADAANDLIQLIVTFTGRENWDRISVVGMGDNNDSDNNSTSEDNLF